jgi:hypothetical protein
MDRNGCDGIFRASVDVYPYSCSELGSLGESNELSLLCRGANQQQTRFNDSIQSHYYMSGKTCTILDKAATICEIFNIPDN